MVQAAARKTGSGLLAAGGIGVQAGGPVASLHDELQPFSRTASRLALTVKMEHRRGDIAAVGSQ
ncbi:MAG TPA: hypothetical protein VGI96_38815 [Streptosporangiaceae bacterium]